MTDKEIDDIYNKMSDEELEREYKHSKEHYKECHNEFPAHILQRGREQLEKFTKLIAPLKDVYIKFPDETPEFFFELKKAEAEVIYTMEMEKGEDYYYDEKNYYSATNYFDRYIHDQVYKLYGFLSLKSNYPVDYQVEYEEERLLYFWCEDIMRYDAQKRRNIKNRSYINANRISQLIEAEEDIHTMIYAETDTEILESLLSRELTIYNKKHPTMESIVSSSYQGINASIVYKLTSAQIVKYGHLITGLDRDDKAYAMFLNKREQHKSDLAQAQKDAWEIAIDRAPLV